MLLERFTAQLPTGDCLEWPNARSKAGYGQLWAGGQVQYVHRIAFVEFNGRSPDGEVRHTCDNPPCFNPAHLIDGSHRQNAHDMLRRMRQPASKLDWSQVKAIRESYATGNVSQRELAKQFGVSQRLIGRILHNASWPKEADPDVEV